MPFTRLLPLFDPEDALRNPLDWRQVDRNAAIRAAESGHPVVVAGRPPGSAAPFHPGSPLFPSTGPYDYAGLRYFVYSALSGFAWSASSSVGGSPVRKVRSPKSEDAEPLEPVAPDSPAGEEEAPASLFNLVWLSTGEGAEKEIQSARLGDTVRLQVGSQGLMPGDSLRLHLVRESDGRELMEGSARLGENRPADFAALEWVLDPKALGTALKPGDRLIPYCRSLSRKLKCQGTPLTLAGATRTGGIRIRFTDPLGQPVEITRGRVRKQGDIRWEGTLEAGLLEVKDLEMGDWEAEVEGKDISLRVKAPWQAYPLVEQAFPLYLAIREDG